MIKYGVFKNQAQVTPAAAPVPEKVAESAPVPPQPETGKARTQAGIRKVRTSTQ